MRLALAGALGATLAAAPAARAAGIAGRWTTFDEDTRQPRAVVEVAADGGGFVGRVVALHTRADEERDPRCDACAPPDRGKPIRGLAILHVSGAREPNSYEGRILDPETGTRYACTAMLSADGSSLEIRAYVGVAALGRTVRWSRAP